MIFLPRDLTALNDTRLQLLDRQCERELKAEIEKITNPRFRRALANALAVEDEINRRQPPTEIIP